MEGSSTNPKNTKKQVPLPFGLREGFDLRVEIEKLDNAINELKVLYEQYFLGILPLAPEKKHQEVKFFIRQLRKAPCKSSALAYRLRSIEQRYSALHTYWQRVLREKEEGTYFKDVFKAKLREEIAAEDAQAATAQGEADRGVQALFKTYKEALEQVSQRTVSLDYGTFKDSLKKRAKELKERHGIKKLSFRVVVKNGKVSVQARAKT